MQLTKLKSKLYGIKVTDADIACDGSITIDTRLLEKAGLQEYEQVHVLDIANGKRFVTYIIEGEAGEMKVNGAAAKLVTIGDPLIVLAYILVDEDEDLQGRYQIEGYPKKVDGRKV
jgi:aspartate 1-decarboxylase